MGLCLRQGQVMLWRWALAGWLETFPRRQGEEGAAELNVWGRGEDCWEMRGQQRQPHLGFGQWEPLQGLWKCLLLGFGLGTAEG